MISKKKTKSSESQKKSQASKKGWATRRLNTDSKPSNTKITRKISSEKLKKLQRDEKVRISSRMTSQKKGKNLHTDKPRLNSKKPTRLARKMSKKGFLSDKRTSFLLTLRSIIRTL